MVKSPPAKVRDVRDVGLIPGSGRSPGEGQGDALQYSCWRSPQTEEPGGLQSVGLQRVRHDREPEHTRLHGCWGQKNQRIKQVFLPCSEPSVVADIRR